jgi:hypothetical protein
MHLAHIVAVTPFSPGEACYHIFSLASHMLFIGIKALPWTL